MALLNRQQQQQQQQLNPSWGCEAAVRALWGPNGILSIDPPF